MERVNDFEVVPGWDLEPDFAAIVREIRAGLHPDVDMWDLVFTRRESHTLRFIKERHDDYAEH